MELKIANYKNLVNIPVVENGEGFVLVDRFNRNIGNNHYEYTPSLSDMWSYFRFRGGIIVREGVARRLFGANKFLMGVSPNLVLFVGYGYRTLDIQRMRFNDELQKCSSALSKEEQWEFTHTKIALPSVAGHPTGGAVDCAIYNIKKEQFLDMGCKIADFSLVNFATYCDKISPYQQANRQLLHDAMVGQGFCPYYGEWWHFSYGDKEWAFFYDQPHALYAQKFLNEVVFKE